MLGDLIWEALLVLFSPPDKDASEWYQMLYLIVAVIACLMLAVGLIVFFSPYHK